jgi:pimeloyl-ACP methyl ester carboxylesterase
MPYLSVKGFNHYYEWITAKGESEPSGKPVLVFVHGWGGSARYWESTAHALADAFDCLLYDMRGFGRSRSESISPSYELETYADDLADLLQQLGVRRVVLNAHSTGSSIAVFFLNRYAELVDRAILTCSGVFEYEERSFKAFHQFGGYVVKFRPRWLYGLPFMDQLFMQRFLRRPIAAADRRAFLQDFLMADEAAALGTMFAAVSQNAAEVMPQEFAKILVPTLLVSGECDQIIPAELGRNAAKMSDRVEQIVIPNTGHFPMLEDSNTYLKAVTTFLEVAVPAVI